MPPPASEWLAVHVEHERAKREWPCDRICSSGRNHRRSTMMAATGGRVKGPSAAPIGKKSARRPARASSARCRPRCCSRGAPSCSRSVRCDGKTVRRCAANAAASVSHVTSTLNVRMIDKEWSRQSVNDGEEDCSFTSRYRRADSTHRNGIPPRACRPASRAADRDPGGASGSAARSDGSTRFETKTLIAARSDLRPRLAAIDRQR